MEKGSNAKFKILVFPWLGFSHVIPYLELSKTLSAKNFYIYFCSSAINLNSIKTSVSNHPSIELVHLQVPALPQLPPELHTTKNLPPNLLPTLIQAFQKSFIPFSNILHATKPDVLIYDFFQPWAAKQALSRGIPAVYFATSGAAPFSFYHHQFTHGMDCSYPYKEIYLLEHEQVDVRARIDPPVVVDGDNDYFGFGVFNLSSDLVLIRSLGGLEGKFIDYLSELCCKKVVPTGLFVRDRTDEGCGGEVLDWLDRKDNMSTVFICFGSDHFLTETQVLAIGEGLDMMPGINFVWVIKFDERRNARSLEDALPGGFYDRVKERGLIIHGWAPQTRILQHRSIGGFISHCGWSSVLESVHFKVPVIGMPMRYDQPIVARLLTDAGAGVEVGKDGNHQFTGEEVAKAIEEVFENRKDELRHGVRKLSEKRVEEEWANEQMVKELWLLCERSRKL